MRLYLRQKIKMLPLHRQFRFVRESFVIHWYIIDFFIFWFHIFHPSSYSIPFTFSSDSFIPILIEFEFTWIHLSHSTQLMIRRKPQRACPTKWNFNTKKETQTKEIRYLMSSFLLNPFTKRPPPSFQPSCQPFSSKLKWYKNKEVKRDEII
jgi:hypothetical protein